MSGNKLFVGGLAWETTDAGLRQAFEQYGSIVEAVVVTDRQTGQSRGFGFVTYGELKAAQEAKNAMDGSALDGRNLRVDFAQERQRTGGGGGGGGRGGGGGGRGGGGGGGRRDSGGGGGRW